MATAAILDFIFVQYFGIHVWRTSNVIHLPNFVQICAIVNELWAINEIQNGGGRHLQFIIFVCFGQMVHFRRQPFTLLQNFIHLRQLAAELLLFVQKTKMTAAAILKYNFVMLDHPLSPFVHLKFPSKFSVDRMCTFRDIAIRRFRQFGLKCPFRPSKIMFLESFDSQTLFFIIETPKRHYLTLKHAFWAINGCALSSVVAWRRGQVYKKGKNTKSNGKCTPCADPLLVVPCQPKPNSARGVISRISFLVSSFIKVGFKVWGSKFWPSHLLGTSLIHCASKKHLQHFQL